VSVPPTVRVNAEAPGHRGGRTRQLIALPEVRAMEEQA